MDPGHNHHKRRQRSGLSRRHMCVTHTTWTDLPDSQSLVGMAAVNTESAANAPTVVDRCRKIDALEYADRKDTPSFRSRDAERPSRRPPGPSEDLVRRSTGCFLPTFDTSRNSHGIKSMFHQWHRVVVDWLTVISRPANSCIITTHPFNDLNRIFSARIIEACPRSEVRTCLFRNMQSRFPYFPKHVCWQLTAYTTLKSESSTCSVKSFWHSYVVLRPWRWNLVPPWLIRFCIAIFYHTLAQINLWECFSCNL